MIKSIKKIAEGVFMLNDNIVVSNFNAKDDHVEYKIDYDENAISEQEASKIAEEFIMKALVDAVIGEK